jgi:hypothetical protein
VLTGSSRMPAALLLHPFLFWVWHVHMLAALSVRHHAWVVLLLHWSVLWHPLPSRVFPPRGTPTSTEGHNGPQLPRAQQPPLGGQGQGGSRLAALDAAKIQQTGELQLQLQHGPDRGGVCGGQGGGGGGQAAVSAAGTGDVLRLLHVLPPCFRHAAAA